MNEKARTLLLDTRTIIPILSLEAVGCGSRYIPNAMVITDGRRYLPEAYGETVANFHIGDISSQHRALAAHIFEDMILGAFLRNLVVGVITIGEGEVMLQRNKDPAARVSQGSLITDFPQRTWHTLNQS